MTVDQALNHIRDATVDELDAKRFACCIEALTVLTSLPRLSEASILLAREALYAAPKAQRHRYASAIREFDEYMFALDDLAWSQGGQSDDEGTAGRVAGAAR